MLVGQFGDVDQAVDTAFKLDKCAKEASLVTLPSTTCPTWYLFWITAYGRQ